MLPLIFGGLAAAGGTAGGIALVVNAANQKQKNDLKLKEQRRHNVAIEKDWAAKSPAVKEGSGIFLNPYKGKGLKEILMPVISKIKGIGQEAKKPN